MCLFYILILCFTVSVYTCPLLHCPQSLNNRPTNTLRYSMISGVILSRQNVLNKISSLVKNIKSSVGDKRSRTHCNHSWPCPTLSQYINIKSFKIHVSSPVGILLFYLLDFCLLYRGWNVLQSIITCYTHISF